MGFVKRKSITFLKETFLRKIQARNRGKSRPWGWTGGRRSAIPLVCRRAPERPSLRLVSLRQIVDPGRHRSPLTHDKSLPVEDDLIRALIDRTTLRPFFKIWNCWASCAWTDFRGRRLSESQGGEQVDEREQDHTAYSKKSLTHGGVFKGIFYKCFNQD